MVNSIVEKSPKALSECTRACRSLHLGDRERGVLHADPGRALADVDQAVLVAIGQRPQQHAPDHGEDGGVGADAEREREDDGDRRGPARGRASAGRTGGR